MSHLRDSIRAMTASERAWAPRQKAAVLTRAVELLRNYEAYDEDHPGREQARAELSDYGMNTFREEARKLGYDNNKMRAILTEEWQRIRQGGMAPNEHGLSEYKRARRGGSMHRMNRKMRVGLFLHFVAAKARGGAHNLSW